MLSPKPSTISWLDRPVHEGKRRRYRGAVGVELEIEGTINFDTDLPVFWSWKEEHSLRGGLEFVLKKPLDLPDLSKALKDLEKTLSQSTLHPTIRCSTHIHVNVSDLTHRQIYQALAYYFLVEDLFVSTQGPLRVGNLFCLRMSDAEHIAYDLMSSIATEQGFAYFNMDGFKYGACNLAAVRHFGSLEFRFFRPLKTSQIYFWSAILHRIISTAKDFPIRKTLQYIEDGKYYEFLKLCLTQAEIEAILDSTPSGGAVNQTGTMLEKNFDFIWKLANRLEKPRKFTIPTYITDVEEDGMLEALDNHQPVSAGLTGFSPLFTIQESLPDEDFDETDFIDSPALADVEDEPDEELNDEF